MHHRPNAEAETQKNKENKIQKQNQIRRNYASTHGIEEHRK